MDSEGKHFEFNINKTPTIGSFLLFSKAEGFIGKGDKSWIIDLKNHQKIFEEFNKENELKTFKEKEKNENKANLRLESITDWLKENQPKIKKRKIKLLNSEEDHSKNQPKALNKPIKKRNKNLNNLIKKLKT